jgi:P-type E1-E2 ATPase
MAPPIVIVLLVTMLKDAVEDYKRHKADRAENEAQALVYDRQVNEFVDRPWKTIRVGDVVKVTVERKFVPADMILLSSENSDGICYVETKNLDGETNFKLK